MGTQSLARPALLNLLWRREDSLPPAAKLGLHAWMRMGIWAPHTSHMMRRAHEGRSKHDHEPYGMLEVCGGDEKSPLTTVSHVHEIMS